LGTYFIGIYIKGKNNSILENSIWHSDGSTLSAGIKVSGKSKFDNNTVLKNRIEYCENGILMFDYS
jgi:hypothetical protein